MDIRITYEYYNYYFLSNFGSRFDRKRCRMDKRLLARITALVQEMRERKELVTVDTVCEALRGTVDFRYWKLKDLKSTVKRELNAARTAGSGGIFL